MTRGLAELGGKKSLHQIPSHRRPDGAPAHAQNVHVIVFDALHGREMIMNQAGAGTLDLVGTDRRANTAPANRYAAIHFSRDHRQGERNNEVRIVVIKLQTVRAEINDLMPGGLEPGDEFFLQPKPAVIRGYADTHILN
jgi:hypothetical protein